MSYQSLDLCMGELAAAFVGQFLDELLAGRDIRGAERRQAGAGARLVQVRKRLQCVVR